MASPPARQFACCFLSALAIAFPMRESTDILLELLNIDDFATRYDDYLRVASPPPAHAGPVYRRFSARCWRAWADASSARHATPPTSRRPQAAATERGLLLRYACQMLASMAGRLPLISRLLLLHKRGFRFWFSLGKPIAEVVYALRHQGRSAMLDHYGRLLASSRHDGRRYSNSARSLIGCRRASIAGVPLRPRRRDSPLPRFTL